jgi:hypothetical protein
VAGRLLGTVVAYPMQIRELDTENYRSRLYVHPVELGSSLSAAGESGPGRPLLAVGGSATLS